MHISITFQYTNLGLSYPQSKKISFDLDFDITINNPTIPAGRATMDLTFGITSLAGGATSDSPSVSRYRAISATAAAKPSPNSDMRILLPISRQPSRESTRFGHNTFVLAHNQAFMRERAVSRGLFRVLRGGWARRKGPMSGSAGRGWVVRVRDEVGPPGVRDTVVAGSSPDGGRGGLVPGHSSATHRVVVGMERYGHSNNWAHSHASTRTTGGVLSYSELATVSASLSPTEPPP